MRGKDSVASPLTARVAQLLAPVTGDFSRQGMLDTNIMILRRWIDPIQLPDEMAISAITLAELSAGPNEVRGNGEQDIYDEHAQPAQRLEILQRAESEFGPIRSAPKRPASSGVLRQR
jgi:hypothetical protein